MRYKIILLMVLVFCVQGLAATYYAIDGGGSWTSASTTMWSTTDHNATGDAGVPAATDDVVIGTTCTGLITLSSSPTAKSLNCKAAGNQILWGAAATITVAGDVNFFPGMSLTIGTGAPTLAISASATLTSGGNYIPVRLSLTGATQPQTVTLADDWILNKADGSYARTRSAR